MRNIIGNWKNIGISFLTAALLVACAKDALNRDANAAPFLGEPGTKESRDAVYKHLQEFDSIGIAGNREASHFPNEVLPALHGWLTEGRGLQRVRWDGREVLLLRPMPTQVIKAILNLAYPDEFRSGFEILQASFWKRVKEAQDEKIAVGFLEPDANFNVSGVYYRTYNRDRGLLLFDVFAGQGTMTHEYRHHVQNLAYQKKIKALWRWEKPSEIGEGCLAQTSSFLGELDATTTEFPSWIGVFRTLEITPAWHRTAVKGSSDPVHFPQSYILITNLDYPGNATARMQDQGCPRDLLSAVEEIKASTDSFSTRVTEDFTNKLFGLRREHFHAWTYRNSKCGGADAIATDPNCARKAERIAAIPHEVEALKEKLDEAIVAEAKDRPTRIGRAFSKLSPELHLDLCKYASAYELLVVCNKR